MNAFMDHIAILVESIDTIIPKIKELQLRCGKVEEFPSEGTRELYVGTNDEGGRLLFIQPIKEGPYQSALDRRGPGLHHIAIQVTELEQYIESLSPSGWYLHPKSLKTLKESRTVWLARPGVPTLLEVFTSGSFFEPKDYVVSKIELPVGLRASLFDFLKTERVSQSNQDRISLSIRGRQYEPNFFV